MGRNVAISITVVSLLMIFLPVDGKLRDASKRDKNVDVPVKAAFDAGTTGDSKESSSSSVQGIEPVWNVPDDSAGFVDGSAVPSSLFGSVWDNAAKLPSHSGLSSNGASVDVTQFDQLSNWLNHWALNSPPPLPPTGGVESRGPWDPSTWTGLPWNHPSMPEYKISLSSRSGSMVVEGDHGDHGMERWDIDRVHTSGESFSTRDALALLYVMAGLEGSPGHSAVVLESPEWNKAVVKAVQAGVASLQVSSGKEDCDWSGLFALSSKALAALPESCRDAEAFFPLDGSVDALRALWTAFHPRITSLGPPTFASSASLPSLLEPIDLQALQTALWEKYSRPLPGFDGVGVGVGDQQQQQHALGMSLWAGSPRKDAPVSLSSLRSGLRATAILRTWAKIIDDTSKGKQGKWPEAPRLASGAPFDGVFDIEEEGTDLASAQALVQWICELYDPDVGAWRGYSHGKARSPAEPELDEWSPPPPPARTASHYNPKTAVGLDAAPPSSRDMWMKVNGGQGNGPSLAATAAALEALALIGNGNSTLALSLDTSGQCHHVDPAAITAWTGAHVTWYTRLPLFSTGPLPRGLSTRERVPYPMETSLDALKIATFLPGPHGKRFALSPIIPSRKAAANMAAAVAGAQLGGSGGWRAVSWAGEGAPSGGVGSWSATAAAIEILVHLEELDVLSRVSGGVALGAGSSDDFWMGTVLADGRRLQVLFAPVPEHRVGEGGAWALPTELAQHAQDYSVIRVDGTGLLLRNNIRGWELSERTKLFSDPILQFGTLLLLAIAVFSYFVNDSHTPSQFSAQSDASPGAMPTVDMAMIDKSVRTRAIAQLQLAAGGAQELLRQLD